MGLLTETTMMEVRKQDKIFLMVVALHVLVAAYLFFVSKPLRHENAALKAEHARLVTPADFPVRKQALTQQRDEAKQELETVRALPKPEAMVLGEATTVVAQRRETLMNLLRTNGLTLVNLATQETRERTSGETLKQTGVRPTPECVRAEVKGEWTALLNFLRELNTARQPIIVDNISLTIATPCKWSLSIWI